MVWNTWLKKASWGKKKGSWGGKWGGGEGKPLPKGTTINKEIRYTGVVDVFNKWKGYGWIKLQQSGVVPGDEVFLYWKSIQSDDRFPFVAKDTVVEFGLHTYDKNGKTYVRAKNITLPGGANIALQDEIDAAKKTFVGGQHLRYTGTLQFFKNGFGYITMDDGYALTEDVPKELKVEQAEFNSGTKEPFNIKKKVAVEFGIVKNQKDQYRAYNMTLPEMTPITQELLEHRKVLGSQVYSGTVSVNMWSKDFGYVDIDPGLTIPLNISSKIKEMNAKAKKGASFGDRSLYFRSSDVREKEWLKKGQKVQFQIYIDDEGCGAFDIH